MKGRPGLGRAGVLIAALAVLAAAGARHGEQPRRRATGRRSGPRRATSASTCFPRKTAGRSTTSSPATSRCSRSTSRRRSMRSSTSSSAAVRGATRDTSRTPSASRARRHVRTEDDDDRGLSDARLQWGDRDKLNDAANPGRSHRRPGGDVEHPGRRPAADRRGSELVLPARVLLDRQARREVPCDRGAREAPRRAGARPARLPRGGAAEGRTADRRARHPDCRHRARPACDGCDAQRAPLLELERPSRRSLDGAGGRSTSRPAPSPRRAGRS